jgi:hypothetical protein
MIMLVTIMSSLHKSQIVYDASHLISGEVRCPKVWDIWVVGFPISKTIFWSKNREYDIINIIN